MQKFRWYVISVYAGFEKKIAQEEVVFMASDQSNKFTKDTWVGDTGATSHMTNSDKGLIDMQIQVGNGKFMNQTIKRNQPEVYFGSEGNSGDMVQLVLDHIRNGKGFQHKQQGHGCLDQQRGF